MTNANESAMPLNEFAYNMQFSSGLTKREYFAAMALQGMLAYDRTRNTDIITRWSVEAADALIKALNEQ